MHSFTPVAIVRGKSVDVIPKSLYIPPAALRVTLQSFEGPLDLLLFLVRKQRLDIMDISMTILVRQYISYVDEVVEEEMELASDYLMMSAWLIEIKTKMMLPVLSVEEESEEDPRADLVRSLLVYESVCKVATQIAALPRRERDFISPYLSIDLPLSNMRPSVYKDQLVSAVLGVLNRQQIRTPHIILQEQISIREVMTAILKKLSTQPTFGFYTLMEPNQGGVTLMALLQLSAESIVDLQQQSDEDELMVALL